MERLDSTENSQQQSQVHLTDGHTRGRVLLLDDDEASLRLMHGVLGAAGYECIDTHHAEEALAVVAQQNNINAIVSDICMPGIDGLMFLDRLRALQIAGPLPQVLFLTGHPSLDNAVAAMRRGAVDFLMKPLRPRELLEAVERVCKLSAQSAQSAKSDLTVEQLAKQAEQLANRLRLLTAVAAMPGAPAASNAQTSTASTTTGSTSGAAPGASAVNFSDATSSAERRQRSEQLLETMEQLRRLRRHYYAELGEMDDVAWDLLVETLRSDREGKQISVSGLSISLEGVSSTTALRRINELVVRGHLRRLPDPSDARRDFVVLDVKARDALEDYLARVAVQLDQASHTSGP